MPHPGMIADPKKDGIPLILQTQNRRAPTAQQQLAIDAFMSHRPAAVRSEPIPDDLIRPPERTAQERKTVRLARQSNRIARLKNSVQFRELENPVWDPRRNRWVDGDEDRQRRLKIAAANLGITLKEETMTDKLSLQAYLTAATENDMTASERGKSSVAQTAEAFEIAAKVRHVTLRVGAKHIGKVEVSNPEGMVIDTWFPDETRENMKSTTSGATVSLAPDKQEDTGTMSKKAKTRKKSAGKGNGAGKPGVIDTIRETVKAKGSRGVSLEEMADILKSKFPDRKRDSMIGTCKIQLPKAAKKTERDDKRGTIYYG